MRKSGFDKSWSRRERSTSGHTFVRHPLKSFSFSTRTKEEKKETQQETERRNGRRKRSTRVLLRVSGSLEALGGMKLYRRSCGSEEDFIARLPGGARLLTDALLHLATKTSYQ